MYGGATADVVEEVDGAPARIAEDEDDDASEVGRIRPYLTTARYEPSCGERGEPGRRDGAEPTMGRLFRGCRR